jgi:dihydroneopterin aldolase
MTNHDRISLKGMRFHTRVGVLPHEKQVPQPLHVDLTVWLSLRQPGQSDSLKDALDYRTLHAVVAETVGDSHHRLIEGLCERIATRALALPGVEAVRVAARKPHAPVDGPLDHVEVVVERDRRRSEEELEED